MTQRLAAAFLAAALALVWAGEAPAAERALYKLELTNKSGAAIREVVLTPVLARNTSAEQSITDPTPHAVKIDIAPGAKSVITRPAEMFLKMVVVRDADTFTFPLISFHGEGDTRASLRVDKPDVPHLVFYDQDNELRMDLSGDNSIWKFPQILGGFPYGVGVTTLAEAKAMGAVAGAKKNELKTKLAWEHSEWAVELRFTGDSPSSVLEFLSMRYKAGEMDNTEGVVENALLNYGYARFRFQCAGKILNDYELQAQGKDEGAIEQALQDMLGDTNAWVVGSTSFYAPEALRDGLIQSAKQGGSARSVFEKNTAAVILAYTVKNSLHTITMLPAGALAADEK